MKAIYEPGYNLVKAGVMLLDLQEETTHQAELNLEPENESRDRSKLMAALDEVNARFGKGTLRSASAAATESNKVWTMKQDRRTPHYTTRWPDIPVARA